MLITAKNIPTHPNRYSNSLDIQLVPGSMIRLRGANGSGKTTVLRVLGGLSYQPQSMLESVSSIFIADKPLLISGLLVAEQLAYYQCLYQCYAHCLDDFGLEDLSDQAVSDLSYGQSQRLSLARLWLSKDKVWLLDEPFNGLDQCGKKWLSEYIMKHLISGGGVIYASHIPIELSIKSVEMVLS